MRLSATKFQEQWPGASEHYLAQVAVLGDQGAFLRQPWMFFEDAQNEDEIVAGGGPWHFSRYKLWIENFCKRLFKYVLNLCGFESDAHGMFDVRWSDKQFESTTVYNLNFYIYLPTEENEQLFATLTFCACGDVARLTLNKSVWQELRIQLIKTRFGIKLAQVAHLLAFVTCMCLGKDIEAPALFAADLGQWVLEFSWQKYILKSCWKKRPRDEDKESLKSSKKVQFDVSVKPLHHEVFRYAKGDKLTYTRTGETVTVVNIHFDDDPPYYTISMPDGREKQTTYENLEKLG